MNEFSNEEFQQTLYHRGLLTGILGRAHELVGKLMENRNLADTKLSCTRRLHRLYRKRQEACRRTVQSRSINVVMDLQEDQWESGEDDF